MNIKNTFDNSMYALGVVSFVSLITLGLGLATKKIKIQVNKITIEKKEE